MFYSYSQAVLICHGFRRFKPLREKKLIMKKLKTFAYRVINALIDYAIVEILKAIYEELLR